MSILITLIIIGLFFAWIGPTSGNKSKNGLGKG